MFIESSKVLHQIKRNLLAPINRHLMAVDAVIFVITPILALFVRLDGWYLVSQYSVVSIDAAGGLLELTNSPISHYWLYFLLCYKALSFLS
jgi:hypothetical protein